MQVDVAGLDMIRAECFVFSHVADEGWMDGCAGDLLRFSNFRKYLLSAYRLYTQALAMFFVFIMLVNAKTTFQIGCKINHFRYRKMIGADSVAVFTDVKKKHR